MKLALIKDGKVEAIELPKEHDYRDIKKLLEIDSPIDCIERKIGGKWFDLWIDDEGALKDDDEITAVTFTNDGYACEFLLGRVLIAHHDSEGYTTGLSDDEIKLVKENLKKDMLLSGCGAEWVGKVRYIRKDGKFLMLRV